MRSKVILFFVLASGCIQQGSVATCGHWVTASYYVDSSGKYGAIDPSMWEVWQQMECASGVEPVSPFEAADFAQRHSHAFGLSSDDTDSQVVIWGPGAPPIIVHSVK